MLFSNCAICTNLFKVEDKMQVTKCGHVFHEACLTQWLKRLKSCPQCRIKCNTRKIFRVYLSTANLEESSVNVDSLTAQLNKINLDLKMKEKDCNTFEKDCKISMLEACDKIEILESSLLKFNEKNKALMSEVKGMDDMRAELKSLKKKVETMQDMSALLSATPADAEQMIQTETNPKKLTTWVEALLHKVQQCERNIFILHQKHTGCVKESQGIDELEGDSTKEQETLDTSHKTPKPDNINCETVATGDSVAEPISRCCDRFKKSVLDTIDSTASTSTGASTTLPWASGSRLYCRCGGRHTGMCAQKYDEKDSSD